MPTISVDSCRLFEKIGKVMPETEFNDLCFEFGLELDGVEYNEITSKTTYKIEVPANRNDLLSLEGIANALGIFIGARRIPTYRKENEEYIKVQKTKEASNGIRPIIVCGVLRNMEMNQEIYNSMIAMQEKLNDGIGRGRSLISIGLHDADKIKSPFIYDLRDFSSINFTPLDYNHEISASNIWTEFKDISVGKYLHLLQENNKCPVLVDSNDTVLAIPPIINGNRSRLSLSTKNIFIDVTATDETRARNALDMLLTTFSEYSENKYTINSVVIEEEEGKSFTTPEFTIKNRVVSVTYLSNKTGIPFTSEKAIECLGKLGLIAASEPDNKIKVTIPQNRRDIIDNCDIMEDAAIGYGFANIPVSKILTHTEGIPRFVERVKCKIREDLAFCGYVETLTFTLTSLEDQKICSEDPSIEPVKINNPKTAEFQCVRTSLLAGMLKSISLNIKAPKPIKLFEISDIVKKVSESETGGVNETRICAGYCGSTSGFEIIHGTLDRVMEFLLGEKKISWRIEKSDTVQYLKGRQASVFIEDMKIGSFGIIAPSILERYKITFPVSVVELSLSKIMDFIQ
eukprot:GHVP01020315.1.p1 GENE.GHVP01020315.1~~GHVP01020315.1.p1  ORF type:complete len:572 (+),score=103.95 GHVP01020315.1:1334-3049(+)